MAAACRRTYIAGMARATSMIRPWTAKPCIQGALWLGLASCLAGAAEGAVPEITAPVTTEFATYVPVPVAVTPNARQFTVLPDLGNVENAAAFTLDPAQAARLAEHGFLIVVDPVPLYSQGFDQGTAYQNMADVYFEAQNRYAPAFVTTDALLHAFHRLFDHVLRRTEEQYLIPTLRHLARQLLARLAAVHDASTDAAVVEAARLAGTHVAVGLRLLDPAAAVPDWVRPGLDDELALIEAHTGFQIAPLFHAFVEDYSQYIPRGHYTRSEELKRYFKAMMWFGRMAFVIHEGSFGEPGTSRPDLTAAALLVVRELDRLDEQGRPAERWATIWVPTVFFVGEGDDPLPVHYRDLAGAVYGARPADLTPERLCDPAKLDEFMARAETELPQPRIRGPVGPGMRLFAQRFIPDSWYLSELTLPAVEDRHFPSVLDVLSVLGSAEAERLQRQAGEEDRFADYLPTVLRLRADVETGPPERWAATLYWNWLYTLGSLLGEWGEGFPPFMRDPLWPRRQIMTAAGSWTELRHDTILYAKGSYGGPTGMDPNAPFVQGYVEPNPWLFARLAGLAGYARAGLDRLGVLEPEAASKLEEMERGALLLADIAARELERRPVSAEESQFIAGFAQWLSNLLKLETGQIGTFPDPYDRAPVVADVHTDADTSTCLEEGTGYPARMLVVADVEGRLLLCVGAVFVPHEFWWPIANRLTDETWWQILADDPLDLPGWIQEVVAASAPRAAEASAQFGMPEVETVTVSLQHDTVTAGAELVLECSVPPRAVELRAADSASVRIELSGTDTRIVLATSGLPPGELIVVADLGSRGSYSLRAQLTPPVRPPRRRLVRVAPPGPAATAVRRPN